jgi:hypothetical protein
MRKAAIGAKFVFTGPFQELVEAAARTWLNAYIELPGPVKSISMYHKYVQKSARHIASVAVLD